MTTHVARVTPNCGPRVTPRSLLFAPLLILALVASVHAGPMFSAPFLGFDTGSDPHSVAISDLNADGRPDMVTANTGANSISVLLGKTGGTFGLKTDFGTGTRPYSVAIADLNADGRADLVTANADSNTKTVSVLLGNGDGTFGLKTDFATGLTPYSVAVADLNADGRPDLVTANIDYGGAHNTVSVLLGNGDGTFGARIDYDAGSGLTCTTWPTPRGGTYTTCPVFFASVAIADLNADGRLDLAVVNSNPTRVWVLLGNGDGTFAPRSDFIAGSTPCSVAIADLNADGRPDLAVANYSGNTVSVLLGNGDGTFGPKADLATQSAPLSVAIGDLNADGRPDLAVVEAAHTASVLLGNGNGAFGPRMAFHTGARPNAVAIADLNADGRPDLAVAGSPTFSGSTLPGSVSVLRGNGDGTFGTNAEFTTATSPVSVATADLNGDGRPDLALACSVSGVVSVLLGNGNGTFSPRTDFDVGGVTRGPWSVAIADFNADGRLDLVVANVATENGSNVVVLLGNGNGTFGPMMNFGTADQPVSVATADFNGDGRLDLVTADHDPSMASVLLGNGNGTFGPRTDFVTGSEPQSVAIADLNLDGRPDFVTANTRGSSVSVLLGNGNGTFGSKTDFATGPQPYAVAIADLNADGRPDVVTANSGLGTANTVSVLLGNGDGTFGPHSEFVTGSEPVSVAIADLNGDGRPDLTVANSRSNTVSVLLGNGDGTFGTKADFGTWDLPYSVAIADFNADGLPDLAVANSNLNDANTVSVLLNTGDHTVAALLAQFGATSAADGIALRWSFGDASRVSSVTVERASEAAGPWVSIAPELRKEGDVTAALDRTADPGRTYFYRLTAKLVDGSSVTFGPISSTASAIVGATELNLLGSNPARVTSQIQYSVTHAGRVRLEVADVAGRVVTTLFDGVQQPGRFQLAWDGTNRGGRLRSGLYFVRLTTWDGTVARKITWLP